MSFRSSFLRLYAMGFINLLKIFKNWTIVLFQYHLLNLYSVVRCINIFDKSNLMEEGVLKTFITSLLFIINFLEIKKIARLLKTKIFLNFVVSNTNNLDRNENS